MQTYEPAPDILPFNIGVAPSRPVSAETKVRVPADENGPSRAVKAGSPTGKTFGLVGANGQPLSVAPEPVELVSVTGETLNSLTWDEYLAWRKTKCRPFDYANCPSLAVVPFNPDKPLTSAYDLMRERGVEEIDQAVLEFIGEVAELGELFIANGPITFWSDLRDKLIDECGDIFFCGMWALDAWGKNPFYGTDDLEMIRVTPESELAMFAGVIASNQPAEVLGNRQFVSILGGMIFNLMMTAQTHAGLLANSFKKLRYQRREQDVEKQVGRIVNVLLAVNQILIMANSSVEEALKVNQRKLDARFPEGYKPGVGGGIRTGEGA